MQSPKLKKSMFCPSDVIEQNLFFFSKSLEDKTIEYAPDYVARHGPKLTKERILEVREGKIMEVIKGLPDASIEKQSAYWIRAITFSHFFLDAHHRTALATLGAIFDLDLGLKLKFSDAESVELTKGLKEFREALYHGEPMPAKDLQKKDAAFKYILNWLKGKIKTKDLD